MEMEMHKTFKRKGRIGFSPVTCNKDNPTLMVEIISPEISLFERRADDPIPFVDITNLETGLEQRLWLSGQLKYQIETLQKTRKTLTGIKLELQFKGTQKVEILGKVQDVNQYELFELE